MIVVHINSNDINWDIILILPSIEYLLQLEKAENIIITIDIPINQTSTIIER